jgi:fumarylacetoacetate (FAA) hydrolase
VAPRLAAPRRAAARRQGAGLVRARHRALAAPLPRAYQWADGSAYVVHVELVRKARGVEMPPSFWTDPLMYQGGSDSFVGCNDEIELADEAWGIDFEGEIGVIVDDVPMGISPEAARKHIKLVTILNDVSLRNVIVGELAKGFGFFHGKPATAFAPVAVTPDELGEAWDGAKLNLPLDLDLQRQGVRPSQRGDRSHLRLRPADRPRREDPLPRGRHGGRLRHRRQPRCVGRLLLHRRAPRARDDRRGKPVTPFMKFGDHIRIEMLDRSGHSIFGAIDQKVVKYDLP